MKEELNSENLYAVRRKMWITLYKRSAARGGGNHAQTPACVAGTPYNSCHTYWFAPQTGRMHWGTFPYNWGAFSYSSLRLLPKYVCSLREPQKSTNSTSLIPRQRGRL